MSNLKIEIIRGIINREGGYVNDPSDSGGETNFGITKDVARANGYKGKMRKLSRSTAFDIYVKRYWDALNLDEVELVSPAVAEEMADTAVNMGVGRAGRFLQRSLNVFNNRGRDWHDLKVDGKIGRSTMRALKAYLHRRGVPGEKVLLRALNALQGAKYIELAERYEKNERFAFGWLATRVER